MENDANIGAAIFFVPMALIWFAICIRACYSIIRYNDIRGTKK